MGNWAQSGKHKQNENSLGIKVREKCKINKAERLSITMQRKECKGISKKHVQKNKEYKS